MSEYPTFIANVEYYDITNPIALIEQLLPTCKYPCIMDLKRTINRGRRKKGSDASKEVDCAGPTLMALHDPARVIDASDNVGDVKEGIRDRQKRSRHHAVGLAASVSTTQWAVAASPSPAQRRGSGGNPQPARRRPPKPLRKALRQQKRPGPAEKRDPYKPPDDRREDHLFGWWETSGHNAQCGAKIQNDPNGPPPDNYLPAPWFAAHINRIAKNLRSNPVHETIREQVSELLPETHSAIDACGLCKKHAGGDLKIYGRLLAEEIQKSNDQRVWDVKRIVGRMRNYTELKIIWVTQNAFSELRVEIHRAHSSSPFRFEGVPVLAPHCHEE
ncbi:hypothetical protein C8R43DRAFT_943981 [Mycena crocata]|nr:hypothetical protein C8R43DRAFT_943981 [Mycena crocata]